MERDVREFIRINRHYMTMAEMANELGYTLAGIRYHLQVMGLKAVEPGVIVDEYILAHPDYSVEQIAEKYNLSNHAILQHAKALGVKLKSQLKIDKQKAAESSEDGSMKEPKELPAYPPELQDGLMAILTDVVKDFTPEDKIIFAKKYLIEQ